MGALLQPHSSKGMLAGCLKTMRLKEMLNNLAFPGPYQLRFTLIPVPGDSHQDDVKEQDDADRNHHLRSLLKIQGGLLKILKARCPGQGPHPERSC